MISSEILDRVEQKLPYRLPEAYREFLCAPVLEPSRTGFNPMTLADPNWETAVEAFLREWHPLNGYLFPIEHCGEGIFACIHLGPERVPVIAWDLAADLGEQPFPMLAASWEEYRRAREEGQLEPLAAFHPRARAQRVLAAQEIERNLACFDRMVEVFCQNYTRTHRGRSFEHHADNAVLKDEDWKPERLAVQDNLLGVMAYRYNPRLNIVEVAGFTTRDHTNFTRGSATAGLLTGLLCEWASKGAEAIQFLSGPPDEKSTRPRPKLHRMPYEVALVGWILGAGVTSDQERLEMRQAEKMLVELTPFPTAVRRRVEARLSPGLGCACLNVHRQIWSPLEVALLAEWCPDAAVLLSGTIGPGEQVRFARLLYHARAAALVGFGQQVLEVEAEAQGLPTPLGELLTDDPRLSYSAVFRPTFPTQWRRAVRDGGDAVQVEAGRPLILVGIPAREPPKAMDGRGQAFQALIAELFPEGATILGIVPDRMNKAPESFPFALIAADVDSVMLDVEAQGRFLQSRRIRR